MKLSNENGMPMGLKSYVTPSTHEGVAGIELILESSCCCSTVFKMEVVRVTSVETQQQEQNETFMANIAYIVAAAAGGFLT